MTEYWYSEIKDHQFGTEPRSLGTGQSIARERTKKYTFMCLNIVLPCS